MTGNTNKAQQQINRSLLSHVIYRSDVIGLDQLIAAGADLNAKRDTPLGDTALHIVAARGNIPFMERLIKAGANIDARDMWGKTPLHHAVLTCYHGSANAAAAATRFLLQSGADANARDEHGRTALFWCLPQNLEMAVLLAHHGADLRNIEDATVSRFCYPGSDREFRATLALLRRVAVTASRPSQAVHRRLREGEVSCG